MSGRVTIVTGGAAHVGAAIVRRFASGGDTVVVADLVEILPDDVPGELVRTDVTDPDAVAALVRATVERFGRVDTLVNNAGIWFRRTLAEITPDEWDRVLAVNVRGAFLCSQAAAPVMAAQGGGSIVNIGSQAGWTVTRGQGLHYHVSKAALMQMARVLAFELGPSNVRVNCVAAGSVRAEGEPLTPGFEHLLDQTPLGRFATPEDIARTCWFLASDDAATITGQTLTVNGGAVAYL